MIKRYFKKKFYNKDLDLIKDKTERFVIFMNDFKRNMGAWYSVLALRVIPFILFLVPVNAVMARFTHYVQMNHLPDFDWDGPILMVIWAAMMALLLILSILAPKAASIFEFIIGYAYLFFVVRNHLYNTPLGITLMICMILYMLVKTFFLVVNIIGALKFAGDPEGVERDESGRIIRATKDEVVYAETEKREEIDANRPLATADNDFLFEKTDDVQPTHSEEKAAFDDDFFFGDSQALEDKSAPEGAPVATDDDFVFGTKEKDSKGVAVAGSDDDYVF